MESDRLFIWLVIAAAVLAPLGVFLVAYPSLTGTPGDVGAPRFTDRPSREVVVRVGESELWAEEARLAHLDSALVDAWVRDELLAQLCRAGGLGNPGVARFVQHRAAQTYFRDILLGEVMEKVPPPTEEELMALMSMDSLEHLVERHYFHILVADSSTADSIRTRLSWGESFQLTAERLSLDQKAGIGGDMGFLTGAELSMRGFPRELARLEGLSDVYRSDRGYHIFLCTETRPLTDTVRVLSSLEGPVLQSRQQRKLDSLLTVARGTFPVEYGESWR